MSTTTMNSLAIEIIESYAQTAKYVVDAYRGAVEKAMAGARGGFAKVADSDALLDESLKSGLASAQKQLDAMLGKGVEAVVNGADYAIDAVAGGATKGVNAIADAAGRLHDKFPSEAAVALFEMNRPVLQLSRDVAVELEKRAKALAKRVVGEAAAASKPAAQAAKAARPARKAAKRAAKA